jgi:hypothetical protein
MCYWIHVTGSGSFLVSLKKKFMDRHREDLSRGRFINAKQSKSKTKVHPPDRREAGSRRSTVLGGPKSQADSGVSEHGSGPSWEKELMCHKLPETELSLC